MFANCSSSTINKKNSIFISTTEIEHLCFIIDFHQTAVCQTGKKVDNLNRMCNFALDKIKVTMQILAKFMGNFESYCSDVNCGNIRCHRLVVNKTSAFKTIWRNFKATVELSIEEKNDFSWWKSNHPSTPSR